MSAHLIIKKQGMKKGGLWLCLIILAIIIYAMTRNPIIDTTFNDKDMLVVMCNDSTRFIFDTGANATSIYTDTVPNGFIFETDIEVNDIFSHKDTLKSYLSFFSSPTIVKTPIQSVLILPESARVNGTDGIWGTDIIGTSSWWIDFTKHRICNNHTPEKEAAYILSYYIYNNLYYTDLSFGQTRVDSILIDTGYTRSDFALPEDILKQLNPKFIGEIPCYNLKNEIDTLNQYRQAECTIKDIPFLEVTFAELPNRKLLGLPFLKRFSAIYIDTKQHQIKCFN